MACWGACHLLGLAFEAVAVASEDDAFGVVDESVDHGGDGDGAAEGLSPGWSSPLGAKGESP